MHIAQLAPLWERVPPVKYGGTELVVSLLTEELIRRGHQVTLFASGDSITAAKLEGICPVPMRDDRQLLEPIVYDLLATTTVYQQAEEFDIIHNHLGIAMLPLARLSATPIVHTLHGVFNRDNLQLFNKFSEQPLISISNSQREPAPHLNYVATVYNAIDVPSYDFRQEPEDPPYLAFLGRVSPEKGLHIAIDVARRSGWRLLIAAKVERTGRDWEYWQVIKPSIDGKQIQFLGEIGKQEKCKLLSGATATLCPINWREPFGLVLIEAMACGSPVISLSNGSAPELIKHGETGLLVEDADEMIEAVRQIKSIDRNRCRKHVEENFSVARMADGYEQAYQKALGKEDIILAKPQFQPLAKSATIAAAD